MKDDDSELTFERYQALASKSCAVQPCRTGQAIFRRDCALVHVGLLTQLTLGALKNFVRHGTLDRPGAVSVSKARSTPKPPCFSFAEKNPF